MVVGHFEIDARRRGRSSRKIAQDETIQNVQLAKPAHNALRWKP